MHIIGLNANARSVYSTFCNGEMLLARTHTHLQHELFDAILLQIKGKFK